MTNRVDAQKPDYNPDALKVEGKTIVDGVVVEDTAAHKAKIAVDLSVLKDQVAVNPDSHSSFEVLLKGIADRIDAATGNPSKLQALTTQLRMNAGDLIAAVETDGPGYDAAKVVNDSQLRRELNKRPKFPATEIPRA